MVDVWYPAASAKGETARYLDVVAFERAVGIDGLKKQLGGAYDVLKSAPVETHAVLGAPFEESLRRSAVLLFSPGGGMVRELYSAQLANLASHGYVVAALTHSYDGFASVFPDGSSSVYDSKRWPKQPSFEGAANLNQLEWHADDMLFVLDELTRLNQNATTSRLPFTGHLDLARVGAFGHSFGGIAAAHACQKDKRLKACLNQDGAVAMAPYFPDARGWGMDQPFMLIERSPRTEPASDAELEEMKVTRKRLEEIVERLRTNRDRILRSSGGGSYQVLLQTRETTHMDFSDLQVLAARGLDEMQAKERSLAAIGDYTRAFFDKHLRGVESPLLEHKPVEGLVEDLKLFAPGKR